MSEAPVTVVMRTCMGVPFGCGLDLLVIWGPDRRVSSIPRVLTTRLRDSPDGVLRLSISTTSMPYRARVMAATRPAGPAPTTSTLQTGSR